MTGVGAVKEIQIIVFVIVRLFASNGLISVGKNAIGNKYLKVIIHRVVTS